METILANLSQELQTIAAQIARVVCQKQTPAYLAATKSKWDARRAVIEEGYEKLLRELQKSKIDGAEFIRLRQQIRRTPPLAGQKIGTLQRDLTTHEAHRRKLLFRVGGY